MQFIWDFVSKQPINFYFSRFHSCFYNFATFLHFSISCFRSILSDGSVFCHRTFFYYLLIFCNLTSTLYTDIRKFTPTPFLITTITIITTTWIILAFWSIINFYFLNGNCIYIGFSSLIWLLNLIRYLNLIWFFFCIVFNILIRYFDFIEVSFSWNE